MTGSIKEIIGYSLVAMNGLINRKSEGILSIYFHDPPKWLFDKIIEWLLQHDFRCISAAELDARISAGEKSGEKLAFLSFDDGCKNNLDLLATIERYGVPVIIFIPVEAVREGNYWWEYASHPQQHHHTGITGLEAFKKLPGTLFEHKISLLKEKFNLNRSCITPAELEVLNQNSFVTLGSHTVTHPILNQCSIEKQRFELIESKRVLENWLKKPVHYFAFPNGNFDENTLELAREAGYRLCFSTIPGRINPQHVHPMSIPRNSINDAGKYYENLAKIHGTWQKIYFKR